MRSVALVSGLVLLFSLSLFCADTSQQNSEKQQPALLTLLAQNNEQQPRIAIGQETLPPGSVLVRTYNENTCLTMHSIYVRRERDSDTTRAVGESTCTPSTRFKVKPKQ